MKKVLLIDVTICPGCGAAAPKVKGAFACATCKYEIEDGLPTLQDLLTAGPADGAYETWSDVDLGRFLRGAVATFMLYAAETSPASAQALGLALAAKHPWLGMRLVQETTAVRKAVGR